MLCYLVTPLIVWFLRLLLFQDGRYQEALGKWEAALNLMPDSAVLHEQKAQVLLELGDAWNALRASTRTLYSFYSTVFFHFHIRM